MGASASRGIDNESLMDKLIETGHVLPPPAERAMRLVDRGSYFEEPSDRAYMDLAWRSGTLHLSAPSIYMTALNHLDLERGQNFLNIGSGSGYLSTIVGLVLGYTGVNHGIELNISNVEFAKARLARFLSESDAPFERDFCVPQFVQGNIFDLVVPAGAAPDTHTQESVSSRPVNTTADMVAQFDPLWSVDEQRGSMNYAADEQPHEIEQLVENEEEVETEEQERQAQNAQGSVLETSGSSDEDEDQAGDRTRSRESSDWILSANIEPPPVVETHAMVNSGDGLDFVQWPTYDRIYVGAAIQSRAQLWAILRLLKIGGVLVAPIRDEFVKLIRLSENTVSRTNLLSVSFATLVVPERDTQTSFDPPPPPQIPTLEQLATRLIRSLLRRVILTRRDGLPTIGRMEKVDSSVRPKKRRNRTEHTAVVAKDTEVQSMDHVSLSPSSNSTVDDCTNHRSKRDCDGDQASELGEDEDNDDEDDDDNDDDDDDDDETIRSHTPTESSPVDRPRSPSNADDDNSLLPRRSMARLLHHLLLSSRIVRQPPAANNQSGSIEPSEDSHVHLATLRTSSDSEDRSMLRSIMLRLATGVELDRTTEPADPPLVVDGSSSSNNTEEQPSTSHTDQSAEALDLEADDHPNQSALGSTSGSSVQADSVENGDTRSQKQPTPRRRHKKRQSQLRYQPPSYQFRDEMREILREELKLGDHYVQLILTL